MPSFVGSAIAHGTASPLTPDFSGVSWADGDFAIATYFTAGFSTVAAPSGWYRLSARIATTSSRWGEVFYKFLATGEDETPSFVKESGTNASSVVVSIYRDVDPDNPFDAFSHPLTAPLNDATPTPSAVTTLVNDAMILTWLGMYYATSFSGGAPSGYTLSVDYTGATYDDRQQMIARKTLTTAGTETPGDWTNTASPGNSEDGIAQTLALREPQTEYLSVSAETHTNTGSGITQTSHDINLPSVVAGDLLIMVVGFGGNCTVDGPPSGFTRLDSASTAVTNVRNYIGWKEATGSEGATVNMTTDNAVTMAGKVLKIEGWNNAVAPGFVQTDNNDVGGIVASSSGKNLYIVSFLTARETFAPNGYNFNQQLIGGAGMSTPVRNHVARKQSPTDTENPGAWYESDPANTPNGYASIIAVNGGAADLGGAGSSATGWGIPIS